MDLIKIAQETLQIINTSYYVTPSGNTVDISASFFEALLGTKYYAKPLTVTPQNIVPNLSVVNETTAQAAARLLSEGKDNIVALNFASATNVGGGWLRGSKAQEEDLCRCSALSACLKTQMLYYTTNLLNDNYYTDGIIYSPNVPFFRDDNLSLLEKPFELSIITSPAPCIAYMTEEISEKRLYQIIQQRAIKILQVAAHNGHKNIILGAWGCGAFGNNPVTVAYCFKKALEEIKAFDNVCFAVYDRRVNQPVHKTFKMIIEG